MASSNDNAMSRFLFAILQQKNLKDIDWNQVAHNPILTQEITNGHAARMRYSRFRQSLLGHEPQRRNRNTNKSKVLKSKKDPKPKKEKDVQTNVRQQDPKAEPDQITSDVLIKAEAGQAVPDARLTPADLSSMASSMADAHLQLQNRLLTPCSDTDMFGPAHQFTASPVSDLHSNEPFNYTGAAAQYAGQGSSSWHVSYSPYLPSYDLEGYSGPAAFCGEHQHSPHQDNFSIDPSTVMAPESSHVPVKQEEWDTRFHS